MIRNVDLQNYRIKTWEPGIRTMNWIYQQLMGETKKGDMLEYVIIGKGEENLYAGVLRGKDGEIKTLVPTAYARFENGVVDSIGFDGETCHDEMDTPGYEAMIGHSDTSMDEVAVRFFKSQLKSQPPL